jgi:hypothetical protein
LIQVILQLVPDTEAGGVFGGGPSGVRGVHGAVRLVIFHRSTSSNPFAEGAFALKNRFPS